MVYKANQLMVIPNWPFEFKGNMHSLRKCDRVLKICLILSNRFNGKI